MKRTFFPGLFTIIVMTCLFQCFWSFTQHKKCEGPFAQEKTSRRLLAQVDPDVGPRVAHVGPCSGQSILQQNK